MRKTIAPYVFIMPALLLLFTFQLYPIMYTVFGSMFTSGAGMVKKFVGLENYFTLFGDPAFWKSLRVTLVFNILVNPFQIASALFLAILVNQKISGIYFFRSIYYVPVCVSLPVASTIWSLMLNPNSGLINSLLGIFSIEQQPFLTSHKQAIVAVIIIASWKGVAYWMMFLLAGLQGISESIYESARIDGSSNINTIFRITIPLLRRPLAFVTVADTIANLLLFVPMYMITNGGPRMSTNTLMFEAFKSAFSYVDLGRSYSIVTLLLILIFVVVSIQTRLLKTDY